MIDTHIEISAAQRDERVLRRDQDDPFALRIGYLSGEVLRCRIPDGHRLIRMRDLQITVTVQLLQQADEPLSELCDLRRFQPVVLHGKKLTFTACGHLKGKRVNDPAWGLKKLLHTIFKVQRNSPLQAACIGFHTEGLVKKSSSRRPMTSLP